MMADNDWTLSGNAGTTPPDTFLGTTDNQPLVIKTNGAEAARIDADGNVGIGTSGPDAKLEVSSGGDFNSPQAHIEQTIPNEYSRLRFNSTVMSVSDPDNPQTPHPEAAPLWDIAVGGG